MDKEISGHGVFIYDAQQTIARYGSIDMVINALKECDMQHAWVRIHGVSPLSSTALTHALINSLRDNGIAVAGWGWCQGAQIEAEVELAITSIREFNLKHYIADIEDGVHNSKWTAAEVKSFLKPIREEFNNAKIGVSTFGFIPYHKPELMKAAEEFADFFAPQVYWFWHPSSKILKNVGETPEKYPLDSSTSYTRLCISEWKKVVNKPLVITGQAYWGEIPGYNQAIAESKLKSFIDNFNDWGKIQGFNWWHLGGKSQEAMSFAMFQNIKNAHLNKKFSTSSTTTQPTTTTAAGTVVAIRSYAEQNAKDKICSTEGVKGISRQIFSILLEVMGTELVSCEDFVEVTGPSCIPFLQPAAAKTLKKAVDEFGEKPKLLHAYRTIAQQYVLYYWFRNGLCNITLAAPLGSSPHEQAIAIDIQENARWRKVLKKHNWRWRGPKDPGHFTYVGGNVSPRIRTEGIRAFHPTSLESK
jgi:hypothetical protein